MRTAAVGDETDCAVRGESSCFSIASGGLPLTEREATCVRKISQFFQTTTLRKHMIILRVMACACIIDTVMLALMHW
jgi:hypothetical protein